MALAYSSAIQDKIALRLHNALYTNLQSQDKTAIDNTWTSGTPGGHAGEALSHVNRYASYVEETSTDEAPAEWESWLVWETVWRASFHVQPGRQQEAMRQRNEAMRAAMSTYSHEDSVATSKLEGLVVSHINIRRYVLDACARRSPFYVPSTSLIDSAIRLVIYRTWEMGKWSWRRYQDVATIPVSSSTTPSLSYQSGNTPDGVSSSVCYYTEDGSPLTFVPNDDMVRHLASEYDSGRPLYFRVTSTASGLVWQFERANDESRTFRCELVRACPALTSDANITTALSLFPQNFLDPIRRMVLAEVLCDGGKEDGYSLKTAAKQDIDNLFTFDSTGAAGAGLERSRSRETVHHTLAGQQHYVPVIGGSV